MAFWGLFVVAVMPVLTTLLITALGLLLATSRVDLLGPNARQFLSNLVFYVFSPAIVGGYLAKSITLDSLATLWFMPVNVFLTFVIGSLLAWLLNKIAKTPPHLQGLVIGCCSAGNLGNLLLIIVPEVCEESDSPFGDSTTCTTNGETYTSISMSIGAIYIWSYVYPIMKLYANKSIEAETDTNIETSSQSTCTQPLLVPSLNYHISVQNSDEAGDKEEEKMKILGKIIQWFKKLTRDVDFKRIIPPSIIAAIVGLTIGVVSPIRKIIIGDDAPLRAIESAVTLVGEAAVPSMTLIVGANLLRGLKGSGVRPSLIIGIIAVRYIALPLLGIGIVKAAYHFGIVGSDSLFQFVLMLQYALPPAMNVGLITQLFNAGQSECSVVLLWTYAVASFSLTLWSTLFMWLVSI